MTAPVLLTPAEAAARIHLSQKTLRQLRQQGLIPYVALTERKIRYRPEDCDAWLESRVRTEVPCAPTQRKRAKAPAQTGKIISFTERRRRAE